VTPGTEGFLPAPSATPAQHRVLADLLALGRPRPRFDPDLGLQLRSRLEAALAPLTDALPVEELWVGKRQLGQIHACEAHWRAAREEEGFDWTARTAAGSVVHKAIELSISSRAEAVPMDLVDHAMASLAEDTRRSSPRPWLLTAAPLELADLRGRAHDTVVKFQECWPRLQAAWAPRTETGIGAELCAGRIVLWGRVDLVLGVARGDEARSLIVDLKTGRSYPGHLDDLRFYALVQTLRIGVPPFRVASYYLDTATFHMEDVTVEMLDVAVRRTVDGAAKMARLLRPDIAAALSPGPTCTWCTLRHECEGAAGYRSARAEADDDIL
jgi:PD-(D/E)XK nuclease superfamily